MVRVISNLPLIGKLAIPAALVVALVVTLVVQALSTVSVITEITDSAINVTGRRLESVLVIQSSVNAAAVAEADLLIA